MNELSHTDDEGRAKMVDVGDKPVQARIARASGAVSLAQPTAELIRENRIKKGDVLTVARIAGIQAAKRTAELVPLCHTLPLDVVHVNMRLESDSVIAESEVRSTGRTGVEMEALVAVSVALLTVYDMCKSVDKNMRIGDIHLVEKVKRDV